MALRNSVARAVFEVLDRRELLAATPAVTPSVVSFTLIDAGTDKPIKVLKGGEQLNLATLPKGLNVRADIAGGKSVGSVRLVIDKNKPVIENTGPASLFGDNNGDYASATFTPGAHVIVAKSYAKANAAGTPGREYKLSFTVVNKPVVSGVVVNSLTLIDAKTDASLGLLSEGRTIDAAVTDITQLNVRADAKPGTVGSVKFVLDNSKSVIENAEPFSFFGDGNGGKDYFAGTLPVGTHTLTVTPYSADNAAGTAGKPVIVHFTVKPKPVVVATPAITGVTLIDYYKNRDAAVIHDGDVIDLKDFVGLPLFRVDANSKTGSVESRIQLAGRDDDTYAVTALDNASPYLLNNRTQNEKPIFDAAGDEVDDRGYYDITSVISPGTYVLTATPFSADDAGGVAGEQTKLTFTVVNTRQIGSERVYDAAKKPLPVFAFGYAVQDLAYNQDGETKSITYEYTPPANAGSVQVKVFTDSSGTPSDVITKNSGPVTYDIRAAIGKQGYLQVTAFTGPDGTGTSLNPNGNASVFAYSFVDRPDTSGPTFTVDPDGDGNFTDTPTLNDVGDIDFALSTRQQDNLFQISNQTDDDLSLDGPFDLRIFTLELPSSTETKTINNDTTIKIDRAAGVALKTVVTARFVDTVNGNSFNVTNTTNTLLDISGVSTVTGDEPALTLSPGESVVLQLGQGSTPDRGRGSGTPAKAAKKIVFRPRR